MPLCFSKEHESMLSTVYRLKVFCGIQFSTCHVTVDDHSVRIPFIDVTTSNNTSVINHFFYYSDDCTH